MTSLSVSVSTSGASSVYSASPLSFHTASAPPSPPPLTTSSASSSQISFNQADEGQFTPPKGHHGRAISRLICLREYHNHRRSYIVRNQWKWEGPRVSLHSVPLDTLQSNSSSKRLATTCDLNPHHGTILQPLRYPDAYIWHVHLPLVSSALP